MARPAPKPKNSTNVVALADARPLRNPTTTSGGGSQLPRHPLDRLLFGLGIATRAASLSSDRDLADAVRYIADAVTERIFADGQGEGRESDARTRLAEIADVARTRTRRSTRGRKASGVADLRPDWPVNEEHAFADLEMLARGDVDALMLAGLVGYVHMHGARVFGLAFVRPDLLLRFRKVLTAKGAESDPKKRVRAILGPRGLGLDRERVKRRTRD